MILRRWRLRGSVSTSHRPIPKVFSRDLFKRDRIVIIIINKIILSRLNNIKEVHKTYEGQHLEARLGIPVPGCCPTESEGRSVVVGSLDSLILGTTRCRAYLLLLAGAAAGGGGTADIVTVTVGIPTIVYLNPRDFFLANFPMQKGKLSWLEGGHLHTWDTYRWDIQGI